MRRFAAPVALAVSCALALSSCAGKSTERGVPTPERDAYRKSVGGLGAGYLYQAHLSVGATADLLSRGAYDGPRVIALMDTAIGMGQNVSEMLRELESVDLSPKDRQIVTDLRTANALIVDEAKALRAFAGSARRHDAATFERARSRAWQSLEHLLNLDPSG